MTRECQRLSDYLAMHSQERPERIALIDANGRGMKYAELHQAVLRKAEGLKGEKAHVMRAFSSMDFVVEYLACHAAGVPAVPIGKDASDEEVRAMEEMLKGCEIPVGVADILFTTGTTGQRKGTMISHRAIIADAENLIDAQGFCGDLTFIITGPLNHIGSLSKLWPSLIVGATVCIIDGLKDMNLFFDAVERAHGKAATFQVPASLRMMMRMAGERMRVLNQKFDFIETGAAAMAQADMDELCATLPHTRLYNTYASTETGIIATHDFNAGPRLAGCLGRPMRHSRLEIGEDGVIVCYGDTLMSGYVGAPEATAKVLRGGAVHTADRGRLDEEGRLHLSGRQDDIINVGGYKVNPLEVEDAAMAYEDVADCICVASPHPVLGQALRLIVVTKNGKALDKRKLASYLAARLERHKVPLLYSQADKVKRTFNGKPDRKSYAQ